MKLIIVKVPGNTLVAQIDDYTGQIPRPGEYITHPPLSPSRHFGPPNVMGVKSVTYGILAREPGLGHYTGSTEPYVEIHV